jgi:hypothetical protein
MLAVKAETHFLAHFRENKAQFSFKVLLRFHQDINSLGIGVMNTISCEIWQNIGMAFFSKPMSSTIVMKN